MRHPQTIMKSKKDMKKTLLEEHPNFQDIVELIEMLKSGYVANGRVTASNERLIFILILVILTKRSIPHVMKIRKNQFKKFNNMCIFRDVSPRAHNVHRIEFPIVFYDYLENYCMKYAVESSGLLFDLNSEYVGNRFRELLKICKDSFSIGNIQTMISHQYNTASYKKQMQKYISLLQIDQETYYFSSVGAEMAKMIQEFMEEVLKRP